MIPEFPNFKKLELSDKEEIEKVTSQFPPYSDFSFVSMWAWDIKGEMRISLLCGNLVVRFTDYITGQPFYSFLGTDNINETAKALLDLSMVEGLKPQLKLIPEEVVQKIDNGIFTVKEDRDHFDYIYNVSELETFKGGKFARKRNQVSLFLKNYPDARAEVLDLKDKNVESSVINLFREWLKRKMDDEEIFESHEEVAVGRILFAVDAFDLMGVGIYIHNKLAAFIINEFTKTNYMIAHASKIDKSFAGINSFLVKENAHILSLSHKEFFNYEQDLGVSNLRDAKMRFRPVSFLKKYQLTQKEH